MIDVYRKIFGLLDRRERVRFVLLAVLTLLMGVIDTLGVASVMPFLAVLADPTIIERSAALGALREITGVQTTLGLQIVLAAIVFVVVIAGVSARAASFYALTRFSKMRVYSIGTRLLGRYLSRGYEWYLSRNTADLGKAILSEVAIAVDGPVDAAMRLMAHGAIALCISAFLIWIEPVGALFAVGVASVCYGAMLVLSHRRLAKLGADRAVANRQRYQIAQEAFGGIKQVKIFDLERSYLRRFRRPARDCADAQARAAIITELPRHALEGIAIGGMLAFILWLLAARDGDLSAVLPVLGAYAFAGARLFPEMQQIFRSLTRIRFGQAALDELHEEFRSPSTPLPQASDEPALPLGDSLVLRDVVYRYPSASRPSLDGVSLEVKAGATVGVVGETGAGKSTLVDVVLGLLTPQSGSMEVDGVPIDADNVGRWRQSIGYVPQDIYIADTTLAANIAFGVDPAQIDLEAVRRAAKAARLHDFACGLPSGYQTPVGERGARLSGGQRQRVGIARALYRDPSVIVFDEATSALDAATEKAVMEAVESLGGRKTIILVAHRLSTVRRCDCVFMVEAGRVVGSGPYDQLVSDSRAFRRIHEAAS